MLHVFSQVWNLNLKIRHEYKRSTVKEEEIQGGGQKKRATER
jgi:hypothetical protein